MEMDETTTREEIESVLANIGECSREKLRVSEIQDTARGMRKHCQIMHM